MKFLLDANLSHETADFLKKIGYQTKTVNQIALGAAEDIDIVNYATRHDYIIITFDLDYGYLFRVLKKYPFGVVVLRLENQTIESANAALKRLISSKVLDDVLNQKSLIVIDENKIRIRE